MAFDMIAWYQEHIDRYITMVCRFGHRWNVVCPHPRELGARIARRKHKAFTCQRCRREKQIWASKVHPDVTGVFDAVERLGGDLDTGAAVMKLWKESHCDAWKAALALAGLLHDRTTKEQMTQWRSKIKSGSTGETGGGGSTGT